MMNEHAVITFTLYPILSRRTYRSEKKKKKKKRNTNKSPEFMKKITMKLGFR